MLTRRQELIWRNLLVERIPGDKDPIHVAFGLRTLGWNREILICMSQREQVFEKLMLLKEVATAGRWKSAIAKMRSAALRGKRPPSHTHVALEIFSRISHKVAP